MSAPRTTPPSLFTAARRVFELSFGEMLWSRRTIFMALVVGGPVILALVFRSTSASSSRFLGCSMAPR
jgi:hypothetical protein